MGRAGGDNQGGLGKPHAVVSSLLALSPLALGISTGWDVTNRGNWKELYRVAEAFNPFCFELSALSASEIPSLTKFVSQELPLNGYVSFHGPSKGMEDVDQKQVIRYLHALRLYGHVIMHPDTMGEMEPYRLLESNLLIENMDSRKPIGAYPDQLEEVFKTLPLANFCLDVAHAKSIDPSMQLAHELIDRFSYRLKEVHISSVDSGDHHIETTLADIQLYSPVLSRVTEVPWILESAPAE
jgi:hypothetical protein